VDKTKVDECTVCGANMREHEIDFLINHESWPIAICSSCVKQLFEMTESFASPSEDVYASIQEVAAKENLSYYQLLRKAALTYLQSHKNDPAHKWVRAKKDEGKQCIFCSWCKTQAPETEYLIGAGDLFLCERCVDKFRIFVGSDVFSEADLKDICQMAAHKGTSFDKLLINAAEEYVQSTRTL